MEPFSFTTLDADSLQRCPEWQAEDRAFFEAHPGRSYHVRPAHPGEYGLDLDHGSIFVVARRSADSTIDRRPFISGEGEPEIDEVSGRALWAIWETDDTGGGVYFEYEVRLLARVFAHVSGPDEPRLTETARPLDQSPQT